MVPARADEIEGHACPACQAHAVTLGKLRAGGVASQKLLTLWRSAQSLTARGTSCPSCQSAMVVVQDPNGLELDICTSCKVLYFDPRELQALAAGSGAPSEGSSAPPAPQHEQQSLRDMLLLTVRRDWPLMLLVLAAMVGAYAVIYDGPARSRCVEACKQAGYSHIRYTPAASSRGGHSEPARCFCLTEAESRSSQGIVRGEEVRF